MPSLKTSNKYPFCVPGLFTERQEVVGIFHAKQIILRLSVYSLAIARERGGNRDSQSQTANRKSLQIIKQKLQMESKPFFYRLGTATSMLSMEDIDN